MVHSITQIRSLKSYTEKCGDDVPHDEILEGWVRETDTRLQDPDTADYYLTLIHMVKKGERDV